MDNQFHLKDTMPSMESVSSESYQQYYEQGLLHTVGFMPIKGGTGSGKTKGIINFLQGAQFQQSGRKAAYIANRHNLLIEFANDLEAQCIKYAYLRSDREIIKELIRRNQLLSIINELADIHFFSQSQAEQLRLLNHRISRLLIRLQEEREEELLPAWRSKVNELCEECYRTIRAELQSLRSSHRDFYDRLVENPAIWRVFPYIQYLHDPETLVLLGTIQKLMRGFFDGRNTIKLTSIENRVLFMDEFDFLENEILSILCQEPSINNPVEFIRIFDEGYSNWQNAPFWQQADMLVGRKQFNEILQFIAQRSDQVGFDFPTISRFRLSPTFVATRPLVIFQTNRIIPLTDFFFHVADNSWEITNVANIHSFAPGTLFTMLQEAIQRLLDTFNYYRTQEATRRDIIQYIWNPKNDNQAGVYQRYIEENHWYSISNPLLIDPLLQPATNQRPAYETGFRYIRLFNQVRSDPDSIDLDQTELSTTPEAVIAKVSHQNLVFALSATLDIPRAVRNFNYCWLRKTVNYIDPNEASTNLVRKIKEKKGQIRGSRIHLIPPREMHLAEKHPMRIVLDMLTSENYFYRPGEEVIDISTITHRRGRVIEFFKILSWILQDSQTTNHLIFCSSMFHIAALFRQDEKTRTVQSFIQEILNPVPYGTGFKACFNGHIFNIVFLNKDKAEEIEALKVRGQYESYISYKDLFTDSTSEKTIVVTQYKTASNGVNLACWNKLGKEEDFTGIHLLEPEYFWFLTKKDSPNDKSPEKQAIWYSWKLMESGQIRWWRFKQVLEELNFQKLNGFYRFSEDCIKNSVALYYQALGRVDRKWQSTPIIEVSLAPPILEHFYSYLTLPDFLQTREEREDYTSVMMLDLHQEIVEYQRAERFNEHFLDYDDIKSINEEGRTYVQVLLQRLSKLRKSELLREQASELRQGWKAIREKLLKQQTLFSIPFPHNHLPDFDSEQLIITNTRFIQPDRIVHISKEDMRIYPHKTLHLETYAWSLSRAYENLKHPAIQEFFTYHGYALKDHSGNNQIWTPYAEQALLLGAIGEKAIQALLEHKGIYVEEEDLLPDSLFEIIDAKIKGTPFYIDFKNFGSKTLEKFSIPIDDPVYDQKFDSEVFLKKLQQKLVYIRQHTSPQAKLVVINLQADEKTEANYFNIHLNKRYHYQEYDIAVIPSAVTVNNPMQLALDFDIWTSQIVHLITNIS